MNIFIFSYIDIFYNEKLYNIYNSLYKNIKKIL